MSTISVIRKNGVLVITHNDPASKNALSQNVYDDICTTIEEAEADSSIGSIILTGGGGFFSSGGNLEILKERLDAAPETRRQGVEHLHSMIRAIRTCSKPIIAAVEGGAAGAGFSLALSCDLIVASADSYFMISYVRVGLTPDGGVTAALAKAIPRQLLFQLAATGEKITATRLHELGIISALSDPGTVLEEATQLADKLANGPAGSLKAIKNLIAVAQVNDFDTQLNKEAEGIAAAFGRPEAMEGISAFLEKRKADFTKFRH